MVQATEQMLKARLMSPPVQGRWSLEGSRQSPKSRSFRTRTNGSRRVGIFQRSPRLGDWPRCGSSFRKKGSQGQPIGAFSFLAIRRAQEGFRRRRVTIQDLIRHTLTMCGAQVPQGERRGREKSARLVTREEREQEGACCIVLKCL